MNGKMLGVLLGACALATVTAGCNGDAGSSSSAEVQGADLSATGPATLRIPVVEQMKVGKSYRKKLVALRNAQFTAAGLDPVPEFVTITEQSGADPFTKLADRINDAAERVAGPNGIDLIQYGDGADLEGGFGKGKQPLCYTGDPKRAIALVQSLTDAVFSDQFVLHAWKYKKSAYDGDSKPFAQSDEAQYEDSFPDVWKEWRGQGEAILMLSSTSDDGDETDPTIILRCR